MGVVYRAQDPAIGRTIAIKTIRLSDLTEPSERDRLRERLFREAQSAGILSHPNIVTIYDILEESGLAYIFMELVNGPTLEALLASAQPPSRQGVIEIFRQTASALDYAHKKGIVHRDIKPANIMIDDDGAAKITDFGVAKIVSQQITQSGAMMGTPTYMSPEQIQGGTIDGRADQFALAVIAYEVLTGEKPFVAEYLPSLLYKICREEPAPPQRINPTLGPAVESVLRKALAKSNADRFATCSEFSRELNAALGASPSWIPLSRGASQSMPTVATSGSSSDAIAPPAAPPPPPVVQSPVLEPVPPTPHPSLPPPHVPHREEVESHTARNVVIALAALVLAITGYLISQKWIGGTANSQPPAAAPPQTSEVKPNAASPVAPPAPVLETEKPSPIGKPPEPAPEHPETAPPAVRPQVTGDVPVEITNAPGGARVIVDAGALGCVTPCALPLARGRHTLVVKLEGYREAQRIIELPQDSAVSLDLERLAGTLSVTSTPAGASIYIDGQLRPEKTPAVLKLPVGTYKLQVVKDNLKYEEPVQIRDGSMSHREYTLE
jgi:serine/threonine protein kinase